ncbi:MAG: hypothetical protein IJK33_07015 [Clostridia bacterium]|nr:hypothetical protein [Clostridia bacterium]
MYKHWVKCSYKYVVDGKEYQISSENAGKPDQVLQSVTVIYQKKRPKYAYIKNMTIPIQPFISFAFFVLGTAFLVCGILYKL